MESSEVSCHNTEGEHMKITYVSNFMNHHQLPFSQGILSQDGVEYTFVALEAIPQERLDMGYGI